MTDLQVARPACQGRRVVGSLALVCAWVICACAPAWAQNRPNATDRAATKAADRTAVRTGDYIVAIVNQELVTAVEIALRTQRAREESARLGVKLPPDDEFKRQITDALIDERAILTFARENGARIEDPELDRALQAIAAQNQLTLDQLRDRLKAEGMDFARYRSNLRDQLNVERTREREVYGRIRTTDADIDRYLNQQREAAALEAGLNLAQVLVSVPEGATPAQLSERRAVIDRALARIQAGEAFDLVARELSEDSNRARGGELGLRPASKYPDLFIENTKRLKVGEVTPVPVRSGAGFHLLKVLSREEVDLNKVTQTKVRHILLRPSARMSLDQAKAQLALYRDRIEKRQTNFEDVAKQISEDGSAAQGGDLGWATPGTMVPEFEEAMNRLAVGGLSEPVTSRFGVHLVQVLERRRVDVDPRQVRDQARNALREQKFEEAYADWVRDLRSRAYIEMREPPL
ncbi:MAG: chaperone/peptidyl-prolyl cis-trans isomerase SurA [Pseudomonadota bacterium]